jgi:hypothetical protein
MHNRIDNYLNPRRTGWLLWNNRLYEDTVPWTWWCDFIAHGKRCMIDEKTIATHLITEFWKSEAVHQDVDHYHWINYTGILSAEDEQAIARSTKGGELTVFFCLDMDDALRQIYKYLREIDPWIN